jgi:hypothetical protein
MGAAVESRRGGDAESSSPKVGFGMILHKNQHAKKG